ncbi:MAG: hypothetical protein ACP5R5_08885 [Armatimonadota bacterium]
MYTLSTEPSSCYTASGSCRREPGSRRGAAYLLAITTLLVGMALALAMLRATGGYFLSEDTRRAKRAAANLAEAGIDYAYWRIHYNGAHLPYSATVSLATGSFQVSAADDGNRDASTVIITSTGTCGTHRHTVRRVALGPLPYHYARCENTNIADGDTITSTASGRGLRANGSIWLGNPSNNVASGAWATSTITAFGTVTPRYPNAPPIRFPDIDYNYYASLATISHPADATYTALNFPGQTVVIVVGRDLTVRGTYNGIITFVVAHDVSVNGPLVPANNSSYVAILALHAITIEAAATTAEGVFYCHNSAVGGRIDVKGVTTINGCAAADTIVTDKTTAFNPLPRLDLNAMRQLRLPGVL